MLFLVLLLLLDLRLLFLTGDLLRPRLDDLFLSDVLLLDTGELSRFELFSVGLPTLLDPRYDPSRLSRGGDAERERDLFLERDLRRDLLLLRLLDLLDLLCDLLLTTLFFDLDLDLLRLDLDLDLLLLDLDLDLLFLEDDLDLFLPVPGPPGIPGPGFFKPLVPIDALTASVVLELDLFFLEVDLDRFRDLDLFLDLDLLLDLDLRWRDLDLLLRLDLDRDLCLLERDLDRDLLPPKPFFEVLSFPG